MKRFKMCEYKLKRLLTKSSCKELDDFIIFFFYYIAAVKRNMQYSLLCQTETKMNVWFYKDPKEQVHIKNNKGFKIKNVI